MSGGIDSSVSAYLLKEQGYDCIGVFMKNWDSSDESESHTTCTLDRDRNDWREVCARLDIPAVEVEFIKEYWHEVFAPMLDSYQSGTQTPNPDVACNRRIKFDHYRRHVFETLGVDAMATGHYARIGLSPSGSPELRTGVDSSKDQSYFLCMTAGSGLRNVLFPVGHLHKSTVKQIGQSQFSGLNVINKRESMGLCFVGKRDMRDFLGGYLTLTPGRFVDLDTGRAVGSHRGKELFTVGQGAKISGASDRYFVTFSQGQGQGQSQGQDSQPGDVFVVRGSRHPMLMSAACHLRNTDMSWIAGAPPVWDWKQPDVQQHLFCKARYNQPPMPCSVRMVDPHTIRVDFKEPVRAVTPGQVLALYHSDVCLGGGIISSQKE